MRLIRAGYVHVQGLDKRVSRTPVTPVHPERCFFKKKYTVFLCFFFTQNVVFLHPCDLKCVSQAINMFFKGS